MRFERVDPDIQRSIVRTEPGVWGFEVFPTFPGVLSSSSLLLGPGVFLGCFSCLWFASAVFDDRVSSHLSHLEGWACGMMSRSKSKRLSEISFGLIDMS